MIRRFSRDASGSYALMTAFAMVPIMGGLALAVDYTEMSNQRQETLNALDAAGIATARRIVEGNATEAQIKDYAKEFFEANLASVKPSNTVLTVVLPNNNAGGGTLKLSAAMKYDPFFYDVFASLLKGAEAGSTQLDFTATSEVRLKNTLEVALVLDNSGSMDYKGSGSGKKRLTLLKDAAKELVTTLSLQAGSMKQISKPVQFGVVPFASAVNVGPSYKTASWMDLTGISPIHHENFNWSTINTANKKTEVVAGVTYARGSDWGALKDKPLTRFTLYDNMRRITGTTGGVNTYANPLAWEGCVEARPYPYNVDDTAPSTATPATLYVPMFAPDEPGNKWTVQLGVIKTFNAYNSWWDDLTTSLSLTTVDQYLRQTSMAKYFEAATKATIMPGLHEGPNLSCTTTAILPLTDVSTVTGQDTVKASIDAMAANGATNVPEGMAWGWRVLSSHQPFNEGRSESEKGNDKVVIVLTDGANTYYTPSSLGLSDPAGNKSTYSAYGYTGKGYNGTTTTRMFMDTSSAVSKTDYSNDNYTRAMNEQFAKLCDNAKAAGALVMTVSLDLSTKDTTENAQITALKACSSDSRFRKNDDGTPVKLFWNATGGTLSDTFKQIGDELSNLRIVG